MCRRLIILFASLTLAYAQKQPFDVNALLSLKRIGDPQISPDGQWVAFTVQSVDVATNKKPQQIWPNTRSFEEAASVFGDPLGCIVPDPRHSFAEERFVLLGLSQDNRLLVR
jgi:dipeptidyl aminopeptidase/acylaminoacyl peptidase